MEILAVDPAQIKAFLLILTRVSVVLFLFPIFSSTLWPTLAKAGLAVLVSILLLPVVPVDPVRFPGNAGEFLILVAAELIIGLALGLTVRLFFAGVQLAGQMVGFQMGFAIINVLDPQTGHQVSIIDQIGHWVAMLVFLTLDGHHIVISALAESFGLAHVGTLSLKAVFVAQLLAASGELFVTAVKIGAPAIAALLFTSAGFGISAKFAPQMNILIAAFPVKIAVGLLFFGFSLHIVAVLTGAFLTGFHATLTAYLVWMGGG